MSRRFSLCVLLLTVFASVAVAFPAKPQPPRLVNDLAGIFTEKQVSELESKLVAVDDTTSNQIMVLTVSDLEGYEPAEYATRIGIDWGVGSKDFNNGVVLLVKPKTPDSGGKVSIQVGYGLEGAIPDAYCKRIIEQQLIPHFKEDDYFGGVNAAVDKLIALATGEISAHGDDSDEEGLGFISFLVIFMLIVVVVLSFRNKKKGKGGGSGTRSRGSEVRPLTEVTAAVLQAVQAAVPQAARSEASAAVHSVAEALPAVGDSNEKNRGLLYVSR